MDDQHPDFAGLSSAISEEAARLFREGTGREPKRLRTIIDDEFVMVVLGNTLTEAERGMVENGLEERVLQLRHDFQMVMRDDLVKAVETSMHRKVIAFISSNHIDPDLAVEVFMLEPKGGDAPPEA